ncbi:N-acetyltransferase family protein [Reinekea sp.]|jgi:GNAT superfamily N-acetyltransferase|uniref:GNAT family N-acetyltransferase n=1 Tax=Reinekea sp. TaxID=1970455 RepID=UPI003989E954
MNSYVQTFKSFGFMALLIEIANSVLARLKITRIERLYKLEAMQLSDNRETSVIIKQLNFDELEKLSTERVITANIEDANRVKAGTAICFGAFRDDILVGIDWFALKSYHHGGGLYACFSDNWICEYGLWLHPDHRGLGLRRLFVSEGLNYAKCNGKLGLIVSVNWNNFPSIRSGEKVGYQYLGLRYWNKRKPFKKRKEYWLTLPDSSIEI